VSSPRTYTHTWTQTRLESIQDQFRFLLMYANIDESYIDKVVVAIAEKAVLSIGVYGCDSSGLKVVEMELRVDWTDHAQLTLETPFIVGGLPGWNDHESPELRVAGRRFAEAVRERDLTNGWWIALAEVIANNPKQTRYWNKRLSIDGIPPEWKGGGFSERGEKLLDLTEADIFLRKSRD
jgi:hypothetical protein